MNARLRLPRRTFLAAAIGSLFVVGVFVVRSRARTEAPAVRSSSHTASAGPQLLVEAVAVRCRTIQPENRLSGQVEPYAIATIASEVAERIVLRPVQQGDAIEKGGLLAALDTRIASAALDQARAAASQATAARRQAESDYARAFIETDADRQQARAKLAQATAARRQAEMDYRRAIIETDAARQQARAQLAQATAGAQKARSFTRRQELLQAQAALAQAQTGERLARTEADRYTWLVRQGASAQQTLDHAQADLDAAVARRQAAEQAVSLAQEGARQEDITAATSQVDTARAAVRVADTRDTRLASLRQQIEGLRAQEAQADAAVRVADTRDTRLATLRQQIAGLRAQEAAAMDAVRQARIALDKHQIFAPFAGRVLATLAESGEMVAPGTPIVRIGAIDRVKVTFAVPEASRESLYLGQTVAVTADALPDRTFAGHIHTLGYQADSRTRTFPVEVTVLNPGERLLPSMVARLRVPAGRAARRTVVPISAVATDGTASYVYVLQNGRAQRRPVTLGAPVGEEVEVTAGLTAGEQIAATPQRLTDGASVRVAGR